MPDTLLFARHGQTEWNLQRRRQGQLDSDLTASGVADATSIADTARRGGVDVIYSSPLGRARATATLAAAATGAGLVVLDDLAEVHHGEFAGFTDAEIQDRFGEQWGRRAAELYTWRFPGGESYEDADRRAAHALDDVTAGPGQVALIVSHEMIGRMLAGRALGLPPAEALKLSLRHGDVYRLVRGRPLTVWELPQDGRTE